MVRLAHRRAIYLRDWSLFKPQIWDGLIDLCSGGNPLCPGHCHTEILFSNGQSFTSTTLIEPETAIYPLQQKRGPVIRRIRFSPEEWDFTPLPLSEAQEADLYAACWDLITECVRDGGSYDWSGVVRFVLPWMKEHPRDWFCTEACVDRLQTQGLFRARPAWRLSPNACYRLCALGHF